MIDGTANNTAGSADRLDRLYDLLPTIYRQRDAEQGYPLRALLQVISEQVNVVEDDIAQLYENWFIETCEEWVAPYIGELVGYTPVHEAGEPGAGGSIEARLRGRFLAPRGAVANTVQYSRRRGTLALLERLAADVAGWPAYAVEFGLLLARRQHLDHLRPKRGRYADLRHGKALDHIGGAFDRLAHTVDVRRVGSHRTPGRYNLPSVGLFVWRMRSYSVTRTPAYCLEEVGPHCYTFSVLGQDTPLYTRPTDEDAVTPPSRELRLPIPISHRAFEERYREGDRWQSRASADYYGETMSLAIWAGNWAKNDPKQPIPRDAVIPADLGDWQYQPPRGKIAVDPERGRIVFPPGQLPRQGVWVHYQYGFSADLGGGEYERADPVVPGEEPVRYTVGEGADYARIGDALKVWSAEKPATAVIEIVDSGAYIEPTAIELAEDQSLEMRAADGARPIVRLIDWQTDRPDALTVTGAPRSRFVMTGILVTGRSVQITGDLESLYIRHCTLVPGWALHCDCEPRRPAEPSLELIETNARVVIENSVLGSIEVVHDEVENEPIEMTLRDTILDATSVEQQALDAPGGAVAHVRLTVERCTIFGRVEVHAIELAENSIFDGRVLVARRQYGCMRFCYVPPGSRTPRRYECQPDGVTTGLSGDEKLREELRVRPQFDSVRYGTPTYARLAATCAEEIRSGADDESEMGVFHDLFQPQRTINLHTHLQRALPAGIDGDIIFAD